VAEPPQAELVNYSRSNAWLVQEHCEVSGLWKALDYFWSFHECQSPYSWNQDRREALLLGAIWHI